MSEQATAARGPMSFGDWVTTILAELQEAGYDVRIQAGFPLVKRPAEFDRGVALLKWQSPSGLPCHKTIYAEGMVMSPMPLPTR